VKKILNEIKKADKIVVFTHRDPDGDAIGSMIAMYLALRSIGKKADMFCSNKVPDIYRFLPSSDKVKDKVLGRYDLGIFVDCGSIERVNGGADIDTIADVNINIDHHPDNTRFGDINYIEPISSVSEIIFKLFKKMNVKITKDIATCLYAGVITDTGNFRYDYTTSETFEVAKQLKKAGADSTFIAMSVYENKTLSSVKILGAAMHGLESSKSGKVAWAVITKKMMDDAGASDEDLTGIVDLIRSVKGVEVAILFREEDYGTKVNFRSKFKVNVSAIAGRLGGGGHVRASGAVVNADIKSAQKKVLAEVYKDIK
jgi:bifunctional oligoribonuclease and PAP phosphatase NrnA